MSFIGMDLLFKCKHCREVARVRVKQGDMAEPNFMDWFCQLNDQGFEIQGDDWVCWNHGRGKGLGKPAPVPVLHEEKS